MPEHSDVIVVGARCAGSPLAALLAGRGVSVTVLERASFPKETLSSHLFEADGLAFLDRLGVLERVRATGAPLIAQTDTRVEDVYLRMPLPQRPGDPGGIVSVRRGALDAILAERAVEAGAQVRMGARVTGLVRERGRVVGVRVLEDEAERELRARLVVGADGRHSTVGRLAGARRYNLTPSQRLLYWAYFEGVREGPLPTFLSHRFGERFILGLPTDGGLYQVLLWPELHERARFQEDRDGAFLEHARACEPLADALTDAKQVGRAIGAFSWEGFFREPCGPGWVLCGDAGHFKSPGPGRGIGDAFMQAERLAETIAPALEGSEEQLDGAMHDWGRWREREFAEHYWLAYDLEEPGAAPAVLVEMLRRLQQQGRAGLFFELLYHRVRPSQLLTPPRLLGAVARLLARGPGTALTAAGAGPSEAARAGGSRRALLAEVTRLGARDMRRRWRNRHPVYASAEQGEEGAALAEEAELATSGS
jgi:flavin-dependent dehydrogenase